MNTRQAAVQTLAVDAQTAEVWAAFDAAGVESLLLKGPVIARALYGEGEPRLYCDTDLLVSPDTLDIAEQILRDLGYEPAFSSRTMDLLAHHGYPWRRPGATPEVDLHHTLYGVGVAPGELWTRLAAHTTDVDVLDVAVRGLDVPATALCAALHAAQHGVEDKPLRDLARAVRQIALDDWREAAGLAERLAALDAFSAGLRALPEGERLAIELQLPPNRSRRVALQAMGAPSAALLLDRLLTTPGIRAKAAILLGKISPSADLVRYNRSRAEAQPRSVVVGYLGRAAAFASQARPAVRAWRKANRSVAGLPRGRRT